MRKIGIITFHASLNFGSALQAFALQTIIKRHAYDAEIINFILESNMEQYSLFRWKFYLTRPQSLLRDLIRFPRTNRRKKAFDVFFDRYFNQSRQCYLAGKSDLTILNQNYDGFVCGSDQIWNLNCTGRLVSEYFLAFADNKKTKIAYAPSMPSAVDQKYYGDLKKYIDRLDYVSVREKQTIAYLKQNVGIQKEVLHVVDPTLLLDADAYIKTFQLEKNDEKYIFVYILWEKDIEALVNRAVELSRNTGLKIRYVFEKRIRKFCNQKYDFGMGPIEFLDTIYNADYILTNSFHATVFSIQFQVPFCVFPRGGSESRMVGLLESLDLMDNIYSPLNEKWLTSRASEDTMQKLASLRSQSLDFLLDGLGNV